MSRRASGADREQMLGWVERVANFCAEQYGMPPITGRILGWLMICDPAEQSATEIAEAIGASRASLTTNMRLLIAGEYVRRRTRPGERTSYYRIDEDAWRRAVQRKLASLDSFRDITGDGLDLLGPNTVRAKRIKNAHETFQWMAELFNRPPSATD
ncbi:MAG TPA: transcriptional regulator [Pseudonocardiaceae bacterium]|jgi:DNA-binding MarR family transcriptional regulator|nr:transcriptional regulator [Pseudonocardiaceae bacterium]